MSRISEWQQFSVAVETHIQEYAKEQYGDAGEDLATDYTVEECLNQVQKYLKRHGKQQRTGDERLDFLKMAHYVAIAWGK